MSREGDEISSGILKTDSRDVNRDNVVKERGGAAMKLASMGTMLLTMLPALTAAASVELTAFADKPFCEKVVALFGEHLGFTTELSKTVQWEPVALKGQGPTTRRCSSFDRTRMDLDNDGQEDLVVKATFCMKRVPSDSLYVFPADSMVLEEASWQDLSPLLATRNKFERTGGTYPLSSLRIGGVSPPPSLTTAFSFQPFVFDGAVYIGMTDAKREWMVIAKYRGGERFEDLCYLQAR